MRISRIALLSIGLAIALPALGQPARADEPHMSIDWRKLQLTPAQSQQIQGLEAQWTEEYMRVQPSIIEDQRKLQNLLSDPKSDSLEIMAVQQSLARKKEQLRSSATANYLRKRQVLDGEQQRSLEDMIRQTIAERQRTLNPGSQTDVMPDRIQNLMQRVRNAWPQK